MAISSVDIFIDSYSPEHLYSMYEIQPMNELLTEYLVCKKLWTRSLSLILIFW